MANEIADSGSIGTTGERKRLVVEMAVFEEAHLAKPAKPR
jgi:hypothetical protein